MNQSHLSYLASPAWADTLRIRLLPWLREHVADLGAVLEIGPGPGLSTDLLLELGATVTAVEIDPDLADGLRRRLPAATVIHGDAAAADLPAGHFTAATCFAMLHHLPSPEHQDRLFANVRHALRPGAPLLGTDAIDSAAIRHGHLDDTFVPVDPETLPARLTAAGFEHITVTAHDEHHFRFSAVASA
ncbi:class I SAM-dependent methyltransferase [Nocardia sp. alder85J]|uniref:class I SAM-dependent methyltransferase n=1 Tax=Nocardia sp. alder85J TaxID=2862949 RepID=UPI001CD70E3C|nr:methyltransferase domain-containing protein [Nocardia sp. alder85J]MCX4092970.1 methyltransferase domain-containing protein [Nocardia sp. alder85J]